MAQVGGAQVEGVQVGGVQHGRKQNLWPLDDGGLLRGVFSPDIICKQQD
jgi:hypothetical protein